jgi:methionyl-tRNA formyltransferase
LAADPAISIEGVITQPDRAAGRGRKITNSPVKEAALLAGLQVYQPESIKSESSQELLNRIRPDAVIIIAYGQIVPRRFLTIPRLGWLNLHASLLPHYRGAAPIHWAIAKGESRTGLTTMQIDAGMDTGPILEQQEMGVGSEETAPELSARMSHAGAELILQSLLRLDRGEISPIAQRNEDASYAPILKKEDGRIDWSHSAQQIYNRMRGFTPWPGAYTTFREQTCHIWGRPVEPQISQGNSTPGEIISSTKNVYVICGEHSRLQAEFVQLQGRKRVTAAEFANGARLSASDRFL